MVSRVVKRPAGASSASRKPSVSKAAIRQRGQPERVRYDAKADARSWAEMCAFFEEVFRLSTDARATPMA